MSALSLSFSISLKPPPLPTPRTDGGNGDDERLLKNLHPTKQRADDFVGGQVSLKPVFKAVKWREDDALIGCAGECCARKACKCDGVRYAGRFPCDFLGLPDNSVSAIQRGAVRQLYNNDGVTLVAFWNEACRRRL